MPLSNATQLIASLARDGWAAMGDEVRGRRVWVLGGRAHIEARGVHHTDAPGAYLSALERRLSAVDGVAWAAVNGVLGDVVVEFDPATVTVDRIRATVEKIEREHGMSGRRRDRPMHPSAFEPVFDELLELAGDLVGAGLGLVGRVVPGLSAPPEAAALISLVDLVPNLRSALEKRFGRAGVELALSLATSVVGAASQTPLSSLADAALRAVELPGVLARRETWQRRAVELAADRRQARAAAPAKPDDRPVSLPDGPVERYTRMARWATGLAAGVLLPMAGVRKAARVVTIGAPKAARFGADAYAAELGRILATRGVVVRDPAQLHLLDRVDTVIIDATAVWIPRPARSTRSPRR